MSRNIAVVGCGAIAQQFYLPVIAKRRQEFGRVWLVDGNEHIRTSAASSIPRSEAIGDLSDIGHGVNLVVIATPNEFHFPLARIALDLGAHVLIEKPFVIWPEDGEQLLRSAAECRRVVAVNQTRRLYPHTQDLRRRLTNGDFGRLKSVVHHEGTKFAWPFKSGAAFAEGAQRTGVIMDIGVHVIDFYQYLLQPTWTVSSSVHDGFKGAEGLAEIELQADEARVKLRLSRYEMQDNVARLSFDHADVLIGLYDPSSYKIRYRSKAGRTEAVRLEDEGLYGIAERVLLNFVAASEGREAAVCDAQSSFPVIALLDEIYCRATRYSEMPGVV